MNEQNLGTQKAYYLVLDLIKENDYQMALSDISEQSGDDSFGKSIHLSSNSSNNAVNLSVQSVQSVHSIRSIHYGHSMPIIMEENILVDNGLPEKRASNSQKIELIIEEEVQIKMAEPEKEEEKIDAPANNIL